MLKNKKSLIIILILIAIIVTGIIIIWKCGFNYELLYGKNTNIEMELGFNYDKSDIEKISKEIFTTYKIQTKGMTNSIAVITVSNITDEQKSTLIQKINEIYELELTEDDLSITDVPNVDIKTTVNQYIKIIFIAIVIIELYLIIRFRKIGIGKIIAISFVSVILSQLVAISIIAILRIKLGEVIMPMLLAIFIADWYVINNIFEEKLLHINKNNNEDKKL